MDHKITLSNTECLLVCEALNSMSTSKRCHMHDREIAERLVSRIHRKVNTDLSIEMAEQAKDRYRS